MTYWKKHRDGRPRQCRVRLRANGRLDYVVRPEKKLGQLFGLFPDFNVPPEERNAPLFHFSIV